MRLPHTTQPTWPAGIPVGRFAAQIERESPEGCAIGLIGLADDHGVKLNGGRVGAAAGPTAFRAALARYGTATPISVHWPRVFDAGDIQPAGDDLTETHRRVTEVTGSMIEAGLFPIAIGGGHDLTFPFVRAVCNQAPLDAGIYFDAHLDVRAEEGSGMPFRRIIENCNVRRLDVLGLDPFSNSAEHMGWFRAHGGRVAHDYAPNDNNSWPPGELFASFDLDVIDQSLAPGVSAMNPKGISGLVARSWVKCVGRCTRVRCFDIMELCPPNDEHGRTARLAAMLFLTFLEGFSERSK